MAQVPLVIGSILAPGQRLAVTNKNKQLQLLFALFIILTRRWGHSQRHHICCVYCWEQRRWISALLFGPSRLWCVWALRLTAWLHELHARHPPCSVLCVTCMCIAVSCTYCNLVTWLSCAVGQSLAILEMRVLLATLLGRLR
jgi:hypothetical protein